MGKKIFTNGHVYTMNKEMPFAEAVVVEGNHIEYVGSSAEALKYESKGAEVIDLDGKMLLPGFIDAHCHPALAAFWLSGLYLDVEMNREEVLAAIKRYVDENDDKENYFGIGYPEWIFDEKGPHKKYLDEICADKPVFFLGSGGHEGWCNSKALEMAGVTKDTPDPIPGFHYYERDEQGETTGHLVESSVTKKMMESVEWFAPEVVLRCFDEIFSEYSEMGVTSLIDCGIFENFEKTALSYIDNYEKQGLLKQRICGCFMLEDRTRLGQAVELLKEQNQKYNSDEFFINTLKVLNDGTVESRSASMFEPYDEDGSNVDPMICGEELQDLCVRAAKEGFDIHIHAIGDRGIHETLMAAKAIRDAGLHDTRITNAHTHVVRPEDDRLFGKYNVIANTSCVWHYGNDEMVKIIGERSNRQFRMLSLIKEGARVSLGSDKPVDEYGPEPLKGIQMGVTRQYYGDSNSPVLVPESERLSIQQCLEGYTINAAYQMHMDDKLGSIEQGKYADIIVLEKDLFEIPVWDIHKTKVVMTMKNGKITYQSE